MSRLRTTLDDSAVVTSDGGYRLGVIESKRSSWRSLGLEHRAREFEHRARASERRAEEREADNARMAARLRNLEDGD